MKHLFYKLSPNIYKGDKNEITFTKHYKGSQCSKEQFLHLTLLHTILPAPNRSDRFLQPVRPVATT